MKSTLLFLYSLLLSVLVSCSPPKKPIGKPNIYHLRDTYYAHFYVFDNFQDNENCIKYLFNFAEKNKGYLIIMTHKNMYKFYEGAADPIDTAAHQFAFSREKEIEGNNNNTRNFRISVNYLEETKLHFKIEQGINKDKLPVKKLSTVFDSLNVNIVQNFLNYSYDDYETQKQSEKYIYELYNKKDSLKIRQVYHNFGKWFEVEIL